jgi:hypothetical protein
MELNFKLSNNLRADIWLHGFTDIEEINRFFSENNIKITKIQVNEEIETIFGKVLTYDIVHGEIEGNTEVHAFTNSRGDAKDVTKS